MSEEHTSEHHTTPTGPHALRQFGPEHAEKPLPDDVAFIDSQFRMWTQGPAYRAGLAGWIMAETNEDPTKRPGSSALAKKWEGQLAELANNSEYDAISLVDDPYEKIFATARVYAGDDALKQAVIQKIERLYKHREASMNPKQQYEMPLPENLVKLLDVILREPTTQPHQ